MRQSWKRIGLIALILALVGVVAIGAVAAAQSSDEESGWPFNMRERLQEAIASVLGITMDEYGAAVDTARAQVLEDAVAEGWLTQEQADAMAERMEGEFGFPRGQGMRGRPFGHGGRGFKMDGWMGSPDSSAFSVAADKLGLTVDELVDELANGKSIAELAADRGIDPQEITDAYAAQLSEWLDEAVTDERLTQKQADAMLENMVERLPDLLERSCESPEGHLGRFGEIDPEGKFGGFGNRMPRGMRGFRDFGEEESGGVRGVFPFSSESESL